MLKVHSIETLWTNEWPWIRVVIFLQWCKFKCHYCHNPDTISEIWWSEILVDEILEIVQKEKEYFQKRWWITFSWWEPLLQADWLLEACKELNKKWYNICIDTNGFILTDKVKELLKYVDIVLLDIKHLDDKKHKELCWVSNKNVIVFIKYLEEIKKRFWVRHVLVPWFTNDIKHINSLWMFLKKFKYMERLEILPYHRLWVYKWRLLWKEYKLENVEPPTNKEINDSELILKKHLKNVYIRQ